MKNMGMEEAVLYPARLRVHCGSQTYVWLLPTDAAVFLPEEEVTVQQRRYKKTLTVLPVPGFQNDGSKEIIKIEDYLK